MKESFFTNLFLVFHPVENSYAKIGFPARKMVKLDKTVQENEPVTSGASLY